MRFDSGQFKEFDGLDNRKSIMDLFVKMGEGQYEHVAAYRRKVFLEGLIKGSTKGFSMVPGFQVSPCSAVDAYHLFIAITGVLNVPIDLAARQLEQVVRRQ